MTLETAWDLVRGGGRGEGRSTETKPNLPQPQSLEKHLHFLFQIHLSLLGQQMGNHSSTNKHQLDILESCFFFFLQLRQVFLSLSRMARLGNPHKQLLQCDLFLTF